MNNRLLVFPTSRAIREYINSIKSQNTLLPKIITIDELFRNSILIGNKKYIDDDLKILYLQEATNFKQFNNLQISRNFSEFFKQSDWIFKFLGELSAENINIDDLKQYDSYAFYIDHLEILKQVQENYINILDQHNLVDKINISSYYTLNQDYINSFEQIDIYLEGYLSNFEHTIIKQVSNITTTILEFEYNKFNQRSINQINNEDLNLELNNKYHINYSSNTILSQNKIDSTKYQATINSFSSKLSQIAFIKHSIYELINKGIEASDIAVILPDEQFASYLKQFDNEHYFNFAMGYNIKDSTTYQITSSIARYLNDQDSQYFDKLTFINIDMDILNLIKSNWHNIISMDLFDKFTSYIKLCEQNDDILLQYEKIIYSIQNIFIKNKLDIKTKDIFKILIQKLNTINIDDTRGGKITVMGVLETRAISFKAVIVCDFNDDIVPKRSTKDKFISSTIKKLASLPTAQDRQNLQMYYYDQLFKNANHIYISFVQNDSSIMSRFGSMLFKDIDNIQDGTKQLNHILYNSSIHLHFDEPIIKNIDLSKHIWSATSLETFLHCKRKFYFKNILKINEHHFGYEPQGFEFGSILHSILEKIYLRQNSFSNEEELKYTILQELSKQKQTNSYLVFKLELFKRQLDKFISSEIKRFNTGIHVSSVEEKFSIKYNGINIRGTIDRIDTDTQNNIYILDYKSSKNIQKNYINNKNNFQMIFYFIACKDRLQNIQDVGYYDLNNGIILSQQNIDDKINELDDIFKSLKTSEVNFEKCEKKADCLYCPYTTLCQRD